ncbi:MAG: methyltransferase domain-containing protein [Thaumarchaeota archaeon]|nr:methyltransferase domain-containing protein [Nitrososphaerota archaeon]
MKPVTEEQALSIRIATHGQFAKYEVNDWILKNLNLKKGERILDIGCGNGKQLIPYAKIVGDKGLAFGVDLSEELLEELKEAAKKSKVSIKVKRCGMEELAEGLGKERFDAAASSFAIYYSKDIDKTVSDIHSLLKGGGRAFICGPTEGNNKELADLHVKVAPLPSKFIENTQFMAKTALPTFEKYFKNVKTSIFKNPITFPNKKAVLDYWSSYTLFNEMAKDRFESLLDDYFAKKSTFVTHKIVLGILAKK